MSTISTTTRSTPKNYARTLRTESGVARPLFYTLAMGGNRITAVADPTGTQDATTKNYVDSQGGMSQVYVDAQDEQHVLKAGDTMTGWLNMSENRITKLGAPVQASDASTAAFVLEDRGDTY